MKKIYLLKLSMLMGFSIICLLGFGQQNNPFSVKQKTKTAKQTHLSQIAKPNNSITTNFNKNQPIFVDASYSTKPFIKPNSVEKELFSSIKHDKNGLLIFAESQVGKEVYFNSRSKESRSNACYAYLDEIKKAMRINNPENEFFELAVWDDELGMAHYKMQQYYEGIKVYGGQIIFHGAEGMINKINGTYYPTPILTNLIPEVSQNLAIATAVKEVKQVTVYKELEQNEKAFLGYNGPEIELIIYHDSRDLTSEKLAYRITLRPNMVEHWVAYVDAKNGSLIEQYNMTCSEGPATAQAQDLNGQSRTIHTYETNGQYYLIDASRSMFNSTQSQMPDNPVGAIWTIDAGNTNMQDLQVSQVTSSNNSWNNPTAVSAHYNAGITYEYFKNTHGRNSIDGEGGTIISIINVSDDDGSGLDNAFWNGKAMFYGNGDQLFYPLAGALDVGGHEISHGVTQHTANLEYKDESGAINEAMSDIVGCMVDRDDWLLAEDIVLPNSPYFPTGAMRDMQDPHNGGSSFNDPSYQPKHTSEMYTGNDDNGGVHINSGIINHAYYMLAEAISKNKAEKLYYRALSNYMTKSSQFIDCRLAFEQSAKDLYGDGSTEFNAVISAFFNVGIGDDSGGGEGTDPPGELPTNPGQDYILFADEWPDDPISLSISNTVASEFEAVTQTPVLRKPSVTDDGSVAVFITEDNTMRAIDLASSTFDEWELQGDPIWDNVAVSKEGKNIAAITTSIDSSIYIYSFVKEEWAKFKLYNPTFTEGVVTYNVLYADALEFDYSGEYLIYDAYNELQNDDGQSIDYWDMGLIRVWNNSSNDWGDGEILKIYSSLPEGVNVGNPSLSKNSPYIMAFDYFDDNNGETFVLGANLETGDIGEIYQNLVLGYPNYSKNDNKLVFTALSTSDDEVVAQVDMKNDKITPVAGASLLINHAKWPVWFAQGTRNITDVSEFVTDSFIATIYPNPFTEEMTVSFELENNSSYSIELYDIYGHRVIKETGNAQKGTVDSKLNSGNLTRGTYFIKISAGDKVTTRKVVKL